jgi:hypothetical protein
VRGKVDEVLDARDSVVVLGGFRLRGALSGATALQRSGAVVFKLRYRRIVGYRACFRREEALEPVGPRE